MFVPLAEARYGFSRRKLRMRTEPLAYKNRSPTAEPIGKAAGIARRIGSRLLHEAREALPPTIRMRLVESTLLRDASHRPISRSGRSAMRCELLKVLGFTPLCIISSQN
jgi:hypothetical protein